MKILLNFVRKKTGTGAHTECQMSDYYDLINHREVLKIYVHPEVINHH
jgi:hypothetical protein